jgi:hypothetical protein
VPNRTQIVCLHEGKKGRSIDPLFIRTLIKKLDPSWIRPWPGNNAVRTEAKGGRSELIKAMPVELKRCIDAGGTNTLVVWADLNHDLADGNALKAAFWSEAQQQGITHGQFDQVVFAFAKDRIENWIEFLNSGTTNEAEEGRRVKHDREAADAAKKLAEHCSRGAPIQNIPPSLAWSCQNWRTLVDRMR